jgi:peptidoglycan/LPS O-acetylase OafA/YrhL
MHIPVRTHAAAEPFLALVLIVMPWILGFDDSDTATTVSVAAGIVVLVVGMTTRWRLSLVKLIPQRVHGLLDMGLGVLLILMPFIGGYTEETGGMVFHIVMGLGFIVAGLKTDWDRSDLAHPGADTGRRTA